MYLGLRYQGTDTTLMVEKPACSDVLAGYADSFKILHQQEFGFNFEEREILIDIVRVRSVGKNQTIFATKIERAA